MDPDLFLVIGMIIGVLAIPSMLSAFSEGRAPRLGALLVLASGALIIVALQNKGGGYTIADLPHVFYAVIGRYIY
ncbi:hypothetical protein [Pseudorhodobacter sp.]|uniref:hypothetical protein n=1 Tax=Pseudorhodobacter sp. TaxID=1934400 RepID=UPI00264754CB|nr:hypothetical protein [Pseudorhodobacter sp.]MDN5786378.1 hypothetical protein [Pseudorhodobacter sp.]